MDFTFMYLQEMFRLKNFITLVALVRSFFLEFNNMVGSLHFMASKKL